MEEYAYEWASLALLLTVEVIYVEYKRLKVERTKLFMAFIQLSIVTDVVNIGYSHILHGGSGTGISIIAELWAAVYLLLSISVYPLFCIYLYEMVAKEEWRNYHRKRFYMFVPVAIVGILLLINTFQHFMYEFLDDGMHDYLLHYFQNYIPILYLIFVCVLSFMNRNKFSKHHIRILCIYVMSTATIFLFSHITGGSLVTGLATGLTVIMAYIYIENPESYVDKETKIFNYEGFEIYAKDHYLHSNDFHAVIISLTNFKTINILTNPNNMSQMLCEFRDWCVGLSDETVCFRMNQSVFAIVSNREVIVNGVYEKIKQELKQDDESRMIIKFGGNIYLLQNCLELKNTDNLAKRIQHISEYSDPDGIKNYFRAKEIEQFLDREIAVEEAVRRAINEESFEMYFQPVYDVHRMVFDKAEALIRLKDPVLGFIPPDEFISLAEQRGLIRKITRQVIRKTVHAIAEKNLQELGVDSININLSTRDMWEGDLKQYLPQVMEEEGIDSSMITLEITETSASGNKEITSDFMNKLVSMGYKFAVDDYGTGYSNIERTISLPFDSVKIDKSLFYMSMEQEKIHYLLEHTIMIFHDMGFKVVVEGAETKEQIDSLLEMNIDYIQGYYYSRPLPLGEYVDFLKKNQAQ